MNRLFTFNIDRVISFLRLGSKHFLPDFDIVLLAICVYHNMTVKVNKMLFETLAMSYCIVRTERKLTYRNNQVGYAL